MHPHPRWWLLPALALLAASCQSSRSVDKTVPRNGQTGVPARSIVAVRLSSGMSEVDAHNTDAGNIVVTGDQTDGDYSGSIVAASFDRVVDGQTVEEFRQGASTPEVPPADPNAEAPPKPPANDTLVFLLDDSVRFKAGEVITVRVSDGVTVHGTAVENAKRFSFTVEGGAASAEGDFFVTATTPGQNEPRAVLAPSMSAEFSLEAKTETLAPAIVVRGEHSGFHEGGSTIFDTTAATVARATRRLDPLDSFVPGETVTVAWGPEIRSSADTALSPFLQRFRVAPGTITGLASGGAGWIEAELARDSGRIVAILPADFRPELAGVEFAVVRASRIQLFASTVAGVWAHSDLDLEVGGKVRGAVTSDTDDDGIPELVLVFGTETGGVIQKYSVDGSGRPSLAGDPVAFPSGAVHAVAVADLNSDGREELIVSHGSTTFTPEPLAEGLPVEDESTGFLTFFELRQGPVDGNIDLSNPDALLEFRYHRVGDPIARFDPSTRIEVHDFDLDGRHDIVAAGGHQLVLYRNQTSSVEPFGFRRVGVLVGLDQAPVDPVNWVVVDFDRDGDLDILTWDGSGALEHENHLGEPPLADSGDQPGEPRGLLFETVIPVAIRTPLRPAAGDVVLAEDLDGDAGGTPDLILLSASGSSVALGSPDAIGAFETPREYGAFDTASARAVADVNGDTALDVLVGNGRAVVALLSESDRVDQVSLPEPSRYELALDSIHDGNVSVDVFADLKERFSGYSFAVDYDETLLEYQGFVTPPSFARRASFELCPTQQLLGCSGTVGVNMTYQSGTIGSPSPHVLLGSLRFRTKSVEELSEARIELRDFDAGERSFRNSVMVSEDGIDHEVPVAEVGDPLTVVVEPPPPEPGAELAVVCTLEERFDRGYRARIRWESPRGEPFNQVLVSVAGEPRPENPIPWEQGQEGLSFEDDHGGTVSISVTALRPGQSAANVPPDAPRESCELISIFRPDVTCEVRDSSNLVRWVLEGHEVDRFNVYRNGVRIAVVSGGSGEFAHEDLFRSKEGADSYEVAGVIGSTEGPRGGCRGQDPEPCVTLDPVIVSSALDARPSPSSPNVVRMRWRNGEAYDRLVGHLRFLSVAAGAVEEEVFPGAVELGGTETEFVYEGDPDRGGAPPGTYTFTLEGRTSGAGCVGDPPEVASSLVVFDPVTVAVPDLEALQLTCLREGLTDLRVTWLPPWRGFDDFLTLRVRHDVAGSAPVEEEISDLLLSDSGALVSRLAGAPLEPFGSYTVTLVARHAGREHTTSCAAVSFDPSLSIGRVEAGVGIDGFEIPVTASGVFGIVNGFELELEFPDFVTLEGISSEPAGRGRRSATIRVGSLAIDPDPDGDQQADGRVELARLRARIPADFGLVTGDRLPLGVSGARIRFEGTSEFRSVEARDGSLLVTGRHVSVDTKVVEAGDRSPIRVGVRLTFTAPAGAPDYAFNAFQIHLKFDAEKLELLPVTLGDQAGTAVAGEGFFVFPDETTLVDANSSGEFKVAWLGFDFTNPTRPAFLEPVTGEEVLVLSFRSRVAAGEPGGFAPITFVTDAAADQPTAFFPVVDVPGVPDLEAFFDGGVRIASDAAALTVSALVPSRGAYTGGAPLELLGRGLPTGPAGSVALRLRSSGTGLASVDPAEIEFGDGSWLRFPSPDSGLRFPLQRSSRLFDLELEVGSHVATLPAAYAYEPPSLSGVDVTSVRALGGDFVRIDGAGLSTRSSVEFVVDGFSDPFPAEIFRASPDGTSIVVVASGLPAPELGASSRGATLRVLLPEAPSLVWPERFRILPPSEEARFAVSEVVPPSASQCGGEVVSVLGQGFTSASTVTLAGALVSDVTLVSARELRFTVPSSSLTGPVDLEVREGISVARIGFEYRAPADFVRGDVNGDGVVSVLDATILSEVVINSGGTETGQKSRDAWDVDDDAVVDFGDALTILSYLFEGGAPPAAPFPDPGQDPDNLADGVCE